MNTKNALFAAQNGSKRTVSKTVSSVTNVAIAARVLAQVKASIGKNCGITTPKESKRLRSLPRLTDAAGKPFCAI